MKIRCLLVAMVGFVVPPVGAHALTLNVSSPGALGLDVGFACLSTAGACSSSAVFSLAASADATGSLTLPGAAIVAGATTGDISLSVLSATFTGLSNGVDEIEFTSVSYDTTASPLFVIDAGSSWNIVTMAASSATIDGTYEQSFMGGNVAGPAAFPTQSVEVTTNCLINKTTLVGQCGFIFGGSRDFTLGVGATPVNHDFNHTFNVVVPEPGTWILVGLGLVTLARPRRMRP